MKKLIFLFGLITFLFIAESQAQKRYGNTTFALDTLTATDAITFTLPEEYGSNNITEMATWQVKVTNIADTLTFNLYVEESIDEASSPDYVVIDTIVASGSSIGGNTLSYLKHYAIRGKKMRLRATSTGSAASAQIEVDSWVRKKVDLIMTDEQ